MAAGAPSNAGRARFFFSTSRLSTVSPFFSFQVEAILDRGTERDDLPPIAWLAAQFEGLGYMSWAHRVVNAAGEIEMKRERERGDGEKGKSARGAFLHLSPLIHPFTQPSASRTAAAAPSSSPPSTATPGTSSWPRAPPSVPAAARPPWVAPAFPATNPQAATRSPSRSTWATPSPRRASIASRRSRRPT